MSTSQFSPDSFLDVTIETPLERREPLPVDDYIAVIGEVKAGTWESQKKGTSGIKWEFPVTVDVPAELQASLGLPPTLQMRDSIMLDLTENGTLDTSKGKNNRLRQYREACDLNKPGDSFTARKLTGQAIKVRITHELYNNAIQERIGAVSKA
jgi:hypothetical protein